MTGNNNPHFVFDGHERARAASMDKIRAQVEAEFAERIQAASWARRLPLIGEMRREIERRLKQVAPPDALYFHGQRRKVTNVDAITSKIYQQWNPDQLHRHNWHCDWCYRGLWAFARFDRGSCAGNIGEFTTCAGYCR